MSTHLTVVLICHSHECLESAPHSALKSLVASLLLLLEVMGPHILIVCVCAGVCAHTQALNEILPKDVLL
jgi:hypothetical protein